MLKDNLKKVEQCVEEACRRAGRSRDEVTLIAVSKTKPVSLLQEAYAEGVRNFGENKVQELCKKTGEMPADVRWHMIGHLSRSACGGDQYTGVKAGQNRSDPCRGQYCGGGIEVRYECRGCHSAGGRDLETGKYQDKGAYDGGAQCGECGGKPHVFSENPAIIC